MPGMVDTMRPTSSVRCNNNDRAVHCLQTDMGIEDLSTEEIKNLLRHSGHIWFDFTHRDLPRQVKRPL